MFAFMYNILKKHIPNSIKIDKITNKVVSISKIFAVWLWNIFLPSSFEDIGESFLGHLDNFLTPIKLKLQFYQYIKRPKEISLWLLENELDLDKWYDKEFKNNSIRSDDWKLNATYVKSTKVFAYMIQHEKKIKEITSIVRSIVNSKDDIETDIDNINKLSKLIKQKEFWEWNMTIKDVVLDK